jgi:hypothetical protein
MGVDMEYFRSLGRYYGPARGDSDGEKDKMRADGVSSGTRTTARALLIG